MKVIAAGLPKTGTKTINAALTLLGYEVYDCMENFWYLGDDWIKQVRGGFRMEDMRRMYENVDAVVDSPCWYFWEEIFDAFPGAKVILTVRPEDSWYQSFQYQTVHTNNNIIMRLMALLTYNGRRCRAFFEETVGAKVNVNGCNRWPWYKIYPRHEESTRRMYRRHCKHVKHVVPKEQLLVYEVKEGWKPLCEFLGLPIPDVPFPHKNKRGNFVQEMRKENPIMKRLDMELKFSLGCLFSLFAFAVYKILCHISGVGELVP